MKPDDPTLLYDLGECYDRLGDTAKAERFYSQCLLHSPNHADCRLRERLKAPAYPVREQSGLIWTYIGPKEHQPPFRSFAWDVVPETHRAVFRANNKASWLPLWEGGLDSSHVAILHTNLVRPSWAKQARGEAETTAMDRDLTPT